MPYLEIACFNTQSALIAQKCGASRIELCANESVGGVTPLLSDLQLIRTDIIIPINIMIRPRGGDFVYSAEEIEQMKSDIKAFAAAGADGFVFGVMTSETQINAEVCLELVKLVRRQQTGFKTLTCTFHRAFDQVPFADHDDALGELYRVRFDAVLTSGGLPDAMQGQEALKGLVYRSGGVIAIIAGGKVRSGNLEELVRTTGAPWYHSSALLPGAVNADEGEIKKMKEILETGPTE